MTRQKLFLLLHIAVISVCVGRNIRAQGIQWMWSGGVTESSAVVKARLDSNREVRLAVSTDASFGTIVAHSHFDAAIRASNDRVVTLEVEGLSPFTDFHYAIEEIDGSLSNLRGHFKTFPDPRCTAPYSYTFALGGDGDTGSNSTIFSAVEGTSPLFLLHLGDLHYEDITTNNINEYRDAYNLVLSQSNQASLYRNTSLVYVWDDHDFGPDNSDSTHVGRNAAKAAYEEYVPSHALVAPGADNGIYHSFNVGRVHFIVTDGRFHRAPRTATDNNVKTVLGNTQKDWFKNQLLAASTKYPVIVWVNPFPWIQKRTAKSDQWGGYATEREELANYIRDNDIQSKLIMVSADAHMVALDDGTNSGYATGGADKGGFVVFQAAGFDQIGNYKGGPYSGGARPGTMQFGQFSVTDGCSSSILITLKGVDDNLDILTATMDNVGALLSTDLVFQAPAPPFELLRFEGAVENANVFLEWETNHDLGNSGYLIEQQYGVEPFSVVGFVEGRGATAGPQTYNYAISDLPPGLYRFRLMLVAFDGTAEELETVVIFIDYDGRFSELQTAEDLFSLPDHYLLETAYPNPFSLSTSIRFAVSESQNVTLSLADPMGRNIRTLHSGWTRAYETQTVRVHRGNLTAGTYFVRLRGETIEAIDSITLVK